MLDVMKRLLELGLIVAVFVTANTAFAVLYKGVDAEGNVVYSDKPFATAEKFTPPPLSIMDAKEVGAAEDEDEGEKKAEFKYSDFSIISPANYQTIRNEAFVNVSIQLKPGLNAAEDHGIWIMLDNKVVVKNSKSLTQQLDGIARGAHQIQAQIRDKNGKLLFRTKPVIIHVHRASAG